MAKNKFCLGMLVIVLVFGMTVAGCDNNTTSGSGGGGGGEGSALPQLNWSTAPLTTQALFASGLTQTQFNQIRNAGGGSFLGWRLVYYDCGYFSDRDYWLFIVWTGSSVDNFTSVANTVAALPNFTQEERGVYNGNPFASGWAEGIIGGIHGTGGVEYGVVFFSRGQYYDEWLSYLFQGVDFFPAGTLYAIFGDL